MRRDGVRRDGDLLNSADDEQLEKVQRLIYNAAAKSVADAATATTEEPFAAAAHTATAFATTPPTAPMPQAQPVTTADKHENIHAHLEEQHPTHANERADSSSPSVQDSVVQQLITSLGKLWTPSQPRGRTVSVHGQGSRVKLAGKKGEDEATLFMVRFESVFRCWVSMTHFARTYRSKQTLASPSPSSL